jgi:hypothetical protein
MVLAEPGAGYTTAMRRSNRKKRRVSQPSRTAD